MIHPGRLKILKANIPYLFRRGTLLNVGANRVRFDLLPELHQAGREITLLEVWPDNANHWQGDKRLAKVVQGDVRRLDKLGLPTFDTVLWWHGPEHIEREELAQTVARLEALAEGLVVLGCPWGRYPQGEFMGNPHDAHRASLYPQDFERLGYRVATLGQADNQGSLVCWKYVRSRQPGPQIPHIVMVTHGGRAEFLRKTIPAVLRSTWPLTLTVVANGPDPEAREYLKLMEPQLYQLVMWKSNKGKPAAANRGWKLRDANYTVLLDDDALAREPDWLRKLVDIADKIPQAGIVGHSVEPTDWPIRVLGEGSAARAVQVQPANLGGACLLVPRRTREKCGYYNEELGPYAESDGLYGWKVRKAGLLCCYFDHSGLGRSFAHLGEVNGETAEYRAWKDEQRREAIQVRDRLIKEYEAGRPLNT